MENRITFVAILVSLLGVLIIGRLFFLQVVYSDYYKSLAERQHVSAKILEPRRGEIFFSPKEGEPIPAATTKSGYVLYIDARKVENAENLFNEVVKVAEKYGIEIDKNDFMERASKKGDPFEIVARRVDSKAAEEFAALGLPGLGLMPEEWRLYPAGSLASHVLGFVGFEGDKITGRYGVERMYESILRGEEGYLEGEYSATGIALNFGRKIFRPPDVGYDLVLTIEPNVQIFLEKTLSEARERWDASLAGGIILDPRTGKVLAMAAKPDFDPNNYGKETNLGIFVNPLIENVYEMGSIFKPLTISSALDAGAVNESTTYYDRGYVILNNSRIENYDGRGRGEASVQDILNQSLNTGAVFVMQKMGKDKFRDYLHNFGLSEKTNIGLPGEVEGNLSNLNSTRDIEYATASFGQGIAVTPIEMARALSALANKGNLTRPYIVERIIKRGEPDDIVLPEASYRVLKEETAERITRMLVKVVDEALLGGTVKMEHFSIAAKTGTAQIPNQNSRGYSDEFLHSFFGYGPAFDAKFLVFLYLEKPYGVRYASQSLGQPFMDIMKFLFSYYDVPPDR